MKVEKFKNPLLAGEKRVLSFDFTDDLAIGEILSGLITVTVSLARGEDATPANILNGAASVDATSKIVLVPVYVVNKKTEYQIKVIAPTNDAKKVIGLAAVLAVV